jgi:thioredoxin 1
MTADLDIDSFDGAIAGGTVLVDFWAPWCAPCQVLAPVLDELAGTVDARIVKVDVEANPQLQARFAITSLPTLIVFRDGEPMRRLYGVKNRRQLTRAIEEVNAADG